MINPANKEASGAQDPGRRDFLINVTTALGTAIVAEALSPFAVSANSRRQAAVKLYETSINVVKNEVDQVISETRGMRAGNDYVLSPTQERGRERAQRVLVRIQADATARERIRVEKGGGNYEYRNTGDTFVFQGFKDVDAPVKDVCDEDNSCKLEYWDGMNIDVYLVRPGGRLQLFYTFPTAFDCNPRNQEVIDTITTIKQEPRPEQTPVPIPPPPSTPVPPKPPVQAPAQVPRKSYEPSLQEEFGAVAILEAGQLGRVIYE